MSQPPTPPPVPEYEPPPAFAPPLLRVAPLNETQVLGRTTYPDGPYAPYPGGGPSYGFPPAPGYPPAPPGFGASPYPPVAWHPALGGASRAAERRRRRFTVLIVSSVVTALIAIAVALTSGGSTGAHSLTLPGSAGGYVKQREITGSALTGLLSSGSFGALPAADIAHAKVAVYARRLSSTPELVFIGFTAADSPTIGAQLHDEQSSYVTRDVIGGAGASASAVSFPAGPLGGSLQCSDIDLVGRAASIGVWADHDTLGIVLLVEPVGRATLTRTGRVTLAMRAAAES